jgi:predicted amidophosphoribosyltransferase
LEHECPADYSRAILQGLSAIGFYHDPRLRKLLHGLKYQYAACLLPTVGDLLRRYKNLRSQPWPWVGESALALQAVVGSPKRIRMRGFDQAEKIRDLVKQELLPWAQTVSLLSRDSSVEAQADLKPGPLRQANVRGVFCVGAQFIAPDVVVLIDDVFTTGSTMLEAARALKSAGVKRVYGLVLAIGA